ncbi:MULTISPECIES: hypothetical protein [unclassified Sphingomonas]|uniref:hypothetical protein n=1 Tax=unclassified Sphingomonas TaxID=196159 RepID=UPI00226A382C|nr:MULTISPECIES: hypothetical protein [unclassified Sphingomonas]
MATGWIGRTGRALAGALMAAALAGCAVTLVPAYDAQIDDGLSALYTDTIAFVDRTTALAGTPEGDYAHNRGFYDGADARVETLIVRAEANRVLKNCPTTRVVAHALDAARIPADVRGAIGTLPRDDCEVVLLRLIHGGFESMRRFHEAQGARGLPPSARGPLIDGGVGAQLRAGITVEIAKRAR